MKANQKTQNATFGPRATKYAAQDNSNLISCNLALMTRKR